MKDSVINKKWTMRKIAEQTFETLFAHTKPSPKTVEEITRLETKMDGHKFICDEREKNKLECVEVAILKSNKEERNISNSLYAPMNVKVIVYATIGAICFAFLAFLTAKVW
jgi:hypothetical protein